MNDYDDIKNAKFFYYRRKNYVYEMRFKEKNNYIKKFRDYYNLTYLDT